MEMAYTHSGHTVTLELIKTKSFEERAVYDESGTDYLYTHFIVDVQFVLNRAATSYIDGPIYEAGEAPADTIRRIRQHLLVPRGLLTCYVHNKLLLIGPSPLPETPDILPAVDCNNGPRPIFCNITSFSGDQTFMGEYRIECWINECTNAAPTILSNRYVQTHAIDDQHMNTITTQGKAVLRTDRMDTLGTQPDFYRYLIFPLVPLGYQRKTITVNPTAGGNELQYIIIDREMFYSLGDTLLTNSTGALRFESIYEVSSVPSTAVPSVASMTSLHTVAVKVWGNKASHKWNLTIFALRIVSEKLDVNPWQPGFAAITQAKVTHYLHDRMIEVVITVRKPPGGTPPLQLQNMAYHGGEYLSIEDDLPQGGDNPGEGINPQFPNANNTRGTSQILAKNAQFLAGCTGPAVVTVGGEDGTGNGSIYLTDLPFISITNTLGDVNFWPDPYWYSNSQKTAFWHSDYRVDTLFKIKYNLYQAPVAEHSFSIGYRVPSEFLELAAPISTKTVLWTGERLSQMPAIPSPLLQDGNWVLLESEITPVAPITPLDGENLIFRVSGKYVFGAYSYLGAGDILPTSVLPWMTNTYAGSSIQISDYSGGIIDAT